MSNDKEKNRLDEKALAIKQSLKYAEDLVKVYEKEKSRRKDLEISNEKIRAIMDSMSDGIAAIDEQFVIFDANKVFCEYFELDKEKVIGRNLLDVLNDSLLKEKISGIKAGAKDKDIFEIEVRQPVNRWMNVSALRIKNDKGYLLVFHDITAEKRAENLKSEFLGILSHELRTPLNAIIGFSDFLFEELEETLDEDQKDGFETLKRSSEKMLHIIEELLNFANLQGKSLEILEENVNISSVLNEVIGEFEEEGHKNMSFNMESEINEPVIAGNVSRVTDLFHHIVKNAVSFGKENGKVHIKVNKVNNYYKIAIADDGIGIPSSELKKVFNSFYQVEEHSTRKTGGLGLGLSLAKRIAELHGGSIRMESSPGKGATCFVSLPVKRESTQKRS